VGRQITGGQVICQRAPAELVRVIRKQQLSKNTVSNWMDNWTAAN